MIENNAYPLKWKRTKNKSQIQSKERKAEKMFEIGGGKNKRRQLTQSSHYTPKPLLIC